MKKIINPDMPEIFAYEADYRKIPRKYLNSSIPKGRGSIKWQPFMSIPEQFENISEYIKAQNKIAMPSLDNDHLEFLNDQLSLKLNGNKRAEITYWKNGHIFSIKCYMKSVNKLEGILEVTNYSKNEFLAIDLKSIIEIN
ncbi:YolD-like family protein [Staphylococcus ratti]|uniref:YolD-like family protein n=1 Tax=Staphylococcus ratti TaxID=2892440 RepID=A0ABY3PF04_9STAP|nr:YolD-like family protein [Staphylococcus ratti]UEX90880.1 YolD-like family protein [Staphylococcus ratti]